MEPLQLWATEGGLVGLVIVSLLGFLGVCIKALLATYKNNQAFIKEILEDEKNQRKAMAEKHTESLRELSQKTAETSERLSVAIDQLTEELRIRNEHHDYLQGFVRGQQAGHR